LEKARIEARRLLQQVQSGSDPFEEKRRRKEEPLSRCWKVNGWTATLQD
jgi:hypothetical protein